MYSDIDEIYNIFTYFMYLGIKNFQHFHLKEKYDTSAKVLNQKFINVLW